MELNPEATAVVVVDMQNDFAHPEGALFAPASGEVIDPINRLVSQARDAGADVVFTRDVHSPDQFDGAHYYDEFDQWGEHVMEDTWGAELVEDLTPREDDLVVEKPTYDAFHETTLHRDLKARGIQNLVICGTLANVCVMHTAASAGLRDYRPVLVEDAVGYIDESHRDYALDHADFLFGEVAARDSITFDN